MSCNIKYCGAIARRRVSRIQNQLKYCDDHRENSGFAARVVSSRAAAGESLGRPSKPTKLLEPCRIKGQQNASTTRRRQMNPWSIWTWPWATTMDMCQRAPESIALGIAAASRDDHALTACGEPEWTTPNHEIIDHAALRLRDFRDFSVGKSRHRPVVVVAPFALHDAGIADLAPGHSLVQALRANGCSRLFLAEWKSATPETRLHTIDTQLAALNVVIDDIGSPLDLIGLCQGGWLSLVYAARFPKKVRRLVLAGAPVDIKAELSLLSTPTNPMTDALIDELLRLGDGLVLGRYLAALWPRELDENSSVIESLQLGGPPATDTERRTAAIFARWRRRALDLPGPYYRQVFDWLYRENRIAAGTFPALGRRIDLRNLHCPLLLLAGARDVIAPPAQVFAAASLVATRKSDTETALAPCGHFALFMGKSSFPPARGALF